MARRRSAAMRGRLTRARGGGKRKEEEASGGTRLGGAETRKGRERKEMTGHSILFEEAGDISIRADCLAKSQLTERSRRPSLRLPRGPCLRRWRSVISVLQLFQCAQNSGNIGAEV